MWRRQRLPFLLSFCLPLVLSLYPVLLAGCALSIGRSNNDKYVCGLLHLGRSRQGATTVIDQHVIGLDVRGGTSDDGVTLGYSALTTVFPSDANHEEPKLGFRWPLGIAWEDESTGVIHEIGWLATRVPSPDDVSLAHHTQLGMGCMMSRRTMGAAIGYRDRVRIEAPVDRNTFYVVRYESDRPFGSVFVAINGEYEDDE